LGVVLDVLSFVEEGDVVHFLMGRPVLSVPILGKEARRIGERCVQDIVL
jgi:hypothetical protein